MTEPEPALVAAILDRALAELAALMAPQAGASCIATNWVLVAEWSTTEGESWMSRWSDESRPPWQHSGLLHEALYGDEWREELER